MIFVKILQGKVVYIALPWMSTCFVTTSFHPNDYILYLNVGKSFKMLPTFQIMGKRQHWSYVNYCIFTWVFLKSLLFII